MVLISFTSLQVISELAGKNVDEVIASGEWFLIFYFFFLPTFGV